MDNPLKIAIAIIIVMALAIGTGLWTRRFRRELVQPMDARRYGSTEGARLYRLNVPLPGSRSRTVGVSNVAGSFIVFDAWTGADITVLRRHETVATTHDEAMTSLGYTVKD